MYNSQEQAIEYLKANLELKRLKKAFDDKHNSHAYIISCGDSVLLDYALKYCGCMAMCKNDTCLSCNSCVKVLNGSHPDVFTLPQLDKKRISVEQIKDLVSDSIIKPLESDIKVYLINAISSITSADWQNKLLKTIEDPPQSVAVFIGVNDASQLLPTVQSRCQQLSIKNISIEQCNQVLICDRVNSKDANIVANLSAGDLAQSYQLLNYGCGRMIEELLEMLSNLKSSRNCIAAISQLTTYKDKLPLALDLLTYIYRDIATINIDDSILLLNDYKNDIISLCNISPLCASLCIDKVLEAKDRLAHNCNIDCVVDWVILQILEVQYKCRK